MHKNLSIKKIVKSLNGRGCCHASRPTLQYNGEEYKTWLFVSSRHDCTFAQKSCTARTCDSPPVPLNGVFYSEYDHNLKKLKRKKVQEMKECEGSCL